MLFIGRTTSTSSLFDMPSSSTSLSITTTNRQRWRRLNYNRTKSYNNLHHQQQQQEEEDVDEGSVPSQQQQQQQQLVYPPILRRIRLLVTSSVLIVLLFFVVDKVPFVSGVAGVVRRRSILAAVGIYRLAQHPFRRRRRQRTRLTYYRQRQYQQHTATTTTLTTTTAVPLTTTTETTEATDTDRSDNNNESLLMSLSTTGRGIIGTRRICTKRGYRQRPNCFGCKAMPIAAFTNYDYDDWVCILRGGSNTEGDDDTDVEETTTVIDSIGSVTVSTTDISSSSSVELLVTEDDSQQSSTGDVGTMTLTSISTTTSSSSLTSLASSSSLEEEEEEEEEDSVSNTTTTNSSDVDEHSVSTVDSVVIEPKVDAESSSSSTTPESIDESIVEPKASSSSPYTFSLYQVGDGSEDDIDKIPIRYMKMQLNNRDKAKHALLETLQWRTEHNIDTIIGQPHTDYDICKAVFPHYFVGHDQLGNVVFVQRPALLNLDLAKKNNLSNQALLDHYVYVNEYLWQIVEGSRPLATMTSIIDLYGLNFSVLRQGDILSFLKVFVSTMDMHFPQRAHITLLLNAPKWFHMIYKLISPMMRESTKEKIKIFSNGSEQDEALRQHLSTECIESLPATFWSSSSNKNTKDSATTTTTDGAVQQPSVASISTLERELREFTLARIQEAGLEMVPVIDNDK